VGIRGVHGQGQLGKGGGVRERDSGDKSRFGGLESGGSLIRPGKQLGTTLEEVCEWAEGLGDGRKKTSVEIDESKETLQSHDVCGGRKILHCLDMTRKRHHTCLTNHMAEKLEGRNGENTLGRIDDQTIVLEDLEELPQVVEMFLQGAAGNQMVI
jgi:hypothetical protein